MSEYITTALQEEEIKTAQEKLAELIRSDFARIDRMKADEEVTDKDGAASEEFTTYLLDTLKSL